MRYGFDQSKSTHVQRCHPLFVETNGKVPCCNGHEDKQKMSAEEVRADLSSQERGCACVCGPACLSVHPAVPFLTKWHVVQGSPLYFFCTLEHVTSILRLRNHGVSARGAERTLYIFIPFQKRDADCSYVWPSLIGPGQLLTVIHVSVSLCWAPR